MKSKIIQNKNAYNVSTFGNVNIKNCNDYERRIGDGKNDWNPNDFNKRLKTRKRQKKKNNNLLLQKHVTDPTAEPDNLHWKDFKL